MSPKTRKTKSTQTLYILTVSGSPHPGSKTSRFLGACQCLTATPVIASVDLATLPLFQPYHDRHPWPASVLRWRNEWKRAAAVVIATPAYLDNLPGVLKNAMDWLSSSGEAQGKRVLPIAYPPHPPRGEHVIQSLMWTLQALGATVPVQLTLYQRDTEILENGDLRAGEQRDYLATALEMLIPSNETP